MKIRAPRESIFCLLLLPARRAAAAAAPAAARPPSPGYDVIKKGAPGGKGGRGRRTRAALAPRRRYRLVALLLAAMMTAAAPAAHPQGKRKKAMRSSPRQVERAEVAAQLARSREDYVKATKEYKASLEQLLAIHEANTSKAEARLGQMKGLYAQGLVSKRALDESESAIGDARARADDLRRQMATADRQIADTLVEAEADEQMAKAPPVPVGRLVRTTSYVRYNAPGGWSLSEAWRVQRFFLEKFGRALPVSAFGQSSVHDRWGLDHRHAMDVPLNPDGPEGQALMIFLRTSGVPFSAFRSAIPGTATGPHIHIGRPSHRL